MPKSDLSKSESKTETKTVTKTDTKTKMSNSESESKIKSKTNTESKSDSEAESGSESEESDFEGEESEVGSNFGEDDEDEEEDENDEDESENDENSATKAMGAKNSGESKKTNNAEVSTDDGQDNNGDDDVDSKASNESDSDVNSDLEDDFSQISDEDQSEDNDDEDDTNLPELNYSSDDSDDEAEKNRIGDLPRFKEWYKEEDFVGYGIDGKKIERVTDANGNGSLSGGNNITQLLNSHDNPDSWRTIVDEKNQESIRLSDRDLEALYRIRQGKTPFTTTDMESMVEYENVDSNGYRHDLHPSTNRPEKKSSFLPSKWEGQKVKRIVRLIREGKIKEEDIVLSYLENGEKGKIGLNAMREKNARDREVNRKKEFIEDDTTTNKSELQVKDLWSNEKSDDDDDDRKKKNRGPTALVAPKMALPGHAESFNPPEEYLFTSKEKEDWENLPEEDRPLNFIPQKYGSLRRIPAYKELITERYSRCLDLYLVPRALKKRMNVDKESLLPKLPPPSELKPFPTNISVVFETNGHKEGRAIRSVSVDSTGHYCATGGDDGYCIIWEIKTGRVVKKMKLGYLVQAVEFHPKDPNIIAVGSESDLYLINLNIHKSWSEDSEKMLEFNESGSSETNDLNTNLNMKLSKALLSTKNDDLKEEDEDGDQDKKQEGEKDNSKKSKDKKDVSNSESDSEEESAKDDDPSNMRRSAMKEIIWRCIRRTKEARKALKKNQNQDVELALKDIESDLTRSTTLHNVGVRILIEHDGLIKQLTWHKKGSYLSVTSLNCVSKANTVVIHNLSSKKSVKPFGGSSKILQTGSGVHVVSTLFHPRKPHYFVATTRSVGVYDLQKQQKLKQLITGNKWISSISIHSNGEHLIVGTLDRRLLWFDLELSSKPYKILKNYHNRGIRNVEFYQEVKNHCEQYGMERNAKELQLLNDDATVESKRTKTVTVTTSTTTESTENGPKDTESSTTTTTLNGKSKKPLHFPLMATTSDDGTIHIFHSKVYSDYLTNPLIVPVKKLRSPPMYKEDKMSKKDMKEKGLTTESARVAVKSRERVASAVLDCVWHPNHPWLISCGQDGKAYLWT